MFRFPPWALLTLLAFAPLSVCQADTYSGSGALASPGNTGDTGSDIYSINFTDAVGCSAISFDVLIETGSGADVHADTRGFGDSGGTNDSFQTTPSVETFSVRIANLTATATGGATFVGSTVAVQFDSFDLVNNGGSSPRVDWVDDQGGSGTTTSTGTTSGFTVTESGLTAGTTQIDLTASGAWMWMNNFQFSYEGEVTVDKGSAIPEPGSAMFCFGLGLIALSRRRR